MGNTLQASYIDVHEAARCGHIEKVRRWIDEGKPVDARDNTQKTPLHHAAQWGQEETLDFLVECGANVNTADFIEDTPLHFACYFGHANCARILIKAGANVNAHDCYGNAPPQIFDDHVTEPVVDEIRLMVREVIRPSLALPAANSQTVLTPSKTRLSSSGDLASAPPMQSPGLYVMSGAKVDGEGVSAEAAQRVEQRRSTNLDSDRDRCNDEKRISDRQGCQTPHILGDFNKSQTLPTNHSIVAQDHHQQQQQQQQLGQTTTNRHEPVGENRQEIAKEARSLVATSSAVVTSLEDSFGPKTRRTNARIFPRLSSVLPSDEELGHETTGSTVGSMGDDISEGVLTARSNIPRKDRLQPVAGSPVATCPGRRPQSAPPMRMTGDRRNMYATNSSLAGRRYPMLANNGGAAVRGDAKKGARLEVTLLAYATMPGGKLDIFAAARDGQVSVLKKALEEGQMVDAKDNNGLTSLMWAARAGRLSTAKYLIYQRAKLELRNNATGFSALHFATYYCRSSVVRALLLAGADTQATDNYGRVPGARYQPSSYLSYNAFHQRRAIRRFLSGDLKDGMDDKGKTLFPTHAPLEAYDEDHKPQYVRLGSGDKITGSPDHVSDEYDERTSATNKGGRKRSGAHPHASLRRSSRTTRKASASMKTLNSKGPKNFSDDEETTRTDGAGMERRERNGAGARQGETGVFTYLRLLSLTKSLKSRNKFGYRDKADGADVGGSSGNGGVKSKSNEAGNGSVKYYLRKGSIQSLPFVPRQYFGDGGDGGDGQDAIAMAMEAAVSAATIDNPEGLAPTNNYEEDVSLDRLEAGRLQWRQNAHGSDVNESGVGESAQAGQQIPMKILDGIQEGAKGLVAHFSLKGDAIGEGEAYRLRESKSQRRLSYVEQVDGDIPVRSCRDAEEGLPEPYQRLEFQAGPPRFNQSVKTEKNTVALPYDRQYTSAVLPLPYRQNDDLVPNDGAGTDTGKGPAACDPTAAATDNAAALSSHHVDPTPLTMLSQEIGTTVITKKGVTPPLKPTDGTDWLHRDRPSDKPTTEHDAGHRHKRSACEVSQMPGLTDEQEEVSETRRGITAAKITTAMRAKRDKADTLGVKKQSAVSDAHVAIATPRMDCAMSEVVSVSRDAASHVDSVEKKRGNILETSKNLDLEAGVIASSISSLGDTNSTHGIINSEVVSDQEAAVRERDISSRSGRKHHHHRHKRRRHRDRKGDEKKRSSRGKTREHSGGEEVNENREKLCGEGDETSATSDVRNTPNSSPTVKPLAPLKRAPPPPNMGLSATGLVQSTHHSGLSLAVTESTRSSNDHDDGGTIADGNGVASKSVGSKALLANGASHR